MCSALRFASIAIIVLAAATAQADRIRVAVQKTGTLAWEIDVIKRHGIDRKLGLAIETVELATTEAGKVALKGGSADIMLSDWLWVARERSLGDTLVFYPASSALGAVMERKVLLFSKDILVAEWLRDKPRRDRHPHPIQGQHCIGSNEHFDRAKTRHQNHCRSAQPMSEIKDISGGPVEARNQAYLHRIVRVVAA
jgi:hypothetical protein